MRAPRERHGGDLLFRGCAFHVLFIFIEREEVHVPGVPCDDPHVQLRGACALFLGFHDRLFLIHVSAEVLEA